MGGLVGRWIWFGVSLLVDMRLYVWVCVCACVRVYSKVEHRMLQNARVCVLGWRRVAVDKALAVCALDFIQDVRLLDTSFDTKSCLSIYLNIHICM